MKYITLRVPKPFSRGPQYDEDGELENGSWPAGLPHEGITGWRKISTETKQGLQLCDFIASDDWPIDNLPGGWRATGSYIWDGITQQEYDEEGNPVGSPYTIEEKTVKDDYAEYFPDENGDVQPYRRHHTYLGWPKIDP